ncbi:ASCH domain-containing protein (plasmid) [Leptospira sp. WS60.C2]
MKILLSIKPEFVEKIFNGEKKFEYRKRGMKNPKFTKVVVYSTMPVGKLIGEFEIEKVLSGSPEEIWEKTSEYSGIQKVFFDNYYCNTDSAIALKIKNVVQYKKPKEPKAVFKNFKAPQSFSYVNI